MKLKTYYTVEFLEDEPWGLHWYHEDECTSLREAKKKLTSLAEYSGNYRIVKRTSEVVVERKV